jgi:hypothetical protein
LKKFENISVLKKVGEFRKVKFTVLAGAVKAWNDD